MVSAVPLKGPVVTGFLLLSVGKLRHRACAERWGARHGRQPAPSHHQGLPAWGVVSVVLSLPQHQVDPRPPQGVEVVAHVMPSPRELATAFPLLTQSQPARWALQNHRSDKNTIKPVLLHWRGWATRPPPRWRDCRRPGCRYQQPCPAPAPHPQQPL